MAERSPTAGSDTQHVHNDRSAERIEWRGDRKPGKRPGTFIGDCPTCKGIGAMRLDLPGMGWETCHSCEGEGTVVRDGEREGDSDRRTQPTWGDVFWCSLWTAVITAGFCWLLISRAGAH